MSRNNPLPDSPDGPHEGPEGLSTGLSGPQDGKITRKKDSTREAVPEGPYVTTAVGGSLSSISPGNAATPPRDVPQAAHSGETKKRLSGLSDKSRRKFLRMIAEIDWDALKGSGTKVFFLTTTYPEAWPEDPATCKAHLRSLLKRLERRYGPSCASFWRMGIQGRTAWHFHVLLFLPPSPGLLKEVREFTASAWWEVCGKISEGHRRAGTSVQELRIWRAMNRAGRYLARKEQFPEDLATGRIWGVRHAEHIPVRREIVAVSLEDFYRIRRAYRRLARKKGTGRVRNMTVFVRHRTVVRLLESLGYRPEDR
ncbi:MAG: DUF4663 domain-containing protein [Actinomycetota bacterium]|nr:DUF4663 domain-containing protein [Actinomycetota bacterium]